MPAPQDLPLADVPVAVPTLPQAAALLAVLPVVPPVILPLAEPITSSNRRPTHTPGLAATNAAFLVPENIWKKFKDGWTTHIPLTFLTDKGCLFKNKALVLTTCTDRRIIPGRTPYVDQTPFFYS